MDDIDKAAENQRRLNEEALAARQRGHGPSETHCVDCEGEIPERRRVSVPGCTRCVECQADQEKRA